VIDGLLGLVSVNGVVFIAVPIDDVNGIIEGSMCAASTFREPQLFRVARPVCIVTLCRSL